jgi:hypothetical protein
MRIYARVHLPLRRRVASAGGDVTPPLYSDSEEGDVTDTVLVVTFNEAVNSVTSDYVTGVTIKVNAVTQTIVSGIRQVNQAVIHYTLAATPDANDVITFEYSDVAGNIADLAGNQLGDIVAQTADNNIGEHLRFTEISDGVHYFAQLT